MATSKKPRKKHRPLGYLTTPLTRNYAKAELPGYVALMALENDWLEEEHISDLLMLGYLSSQFATGSDKIHADAAVRLTCAIQGRREGLGRYYVTAAEKTGLKASVPILLEFMRTVRNVDIAKECTRALRQFDKHGALRVGK